MVQLGLKVVGQAVQDSEWSSGSSSPRSALRKLAERNRKPVDDLMAIISQDTAIEGSASGGNEGGSPGGSDSGDSDSTSVLPGAGAAATPGGLSAMDGESLDELIERAKSSASISSFRTERVYVASSLWGAVIGRGGETIQALQKASRTRILTSREGSDHLIVCGEHKAVVRGVRYIKSIIMNPRNTQPKYHYLPNELVSEIVGHKGSKLKAIQAKTGARISVMPAYDHHPQNPFRQVSDAHNPANALLDASRWRCRANAALPCVRRCGCRSCLRRCLANTGWSIAVYYPGQRRAGDAGSLAVRQACGERCEEGGRKEGGEGGEGRSSSAGSGSVRMCGSPM